MVPIGIWLAVVGYGVAYSGYVQLGGGKCDIISAFRGGCQAPGPGARVTSGSTQAQQQTAAQQQQAQLLSSQPIPQVA